jgi:hypothetical protein
MASRYRRGLPSGDNSGFKVTATGAFESIEVVVRLIGPFDPDQAIRDLAS